jgi:hypothetical protein
MLATSDALKIFYTKVYLWRTKIGFFIIYIKPKRRREGESILRPGKKIKSVPLGYGVLNYCMCAAFVLYTKL